MKRPLDIDWDFDSNHPAEPGWYAVGIGWDICEGVFFEGLLFDGGWQTDSSAQVLAFAGPFGSKEEADEWADENDWEHPR